MKILSLFKSNFTTSGLGLILLCLALLAGCADKEHEILTQTKKAETIIQTASAGQTIPDSLVQEISFSDTMQTDFFDRTCLEPDKSQIISEIYPGQTKKESVTSLRYFLDNDPAEQKKAYQDFLDRQNRDFGKVSPQEKSYSKIYEQDNLAYVLVKVPFQFEKIKLAETEYNVQSGTLYRKYLWQKRQDGSWQLNDMQFIFALNQADTAALFNQAAADSVEKQLEKFLTLFGEQKAEFQ